MAGDVYEDNIIKLVKDKKRALIICHRLSLPFVVFAVICDLKPLGVTIIIIFKIHPKSILNQQFTNKTSPTIRHATLRIIHSVCPHFSPA